MMYGGNSTWVHRLGAMGLLLVLVGGCSWGRGKGVKVPVGPGAKIVHPGQEPSPAPGSARPELSPVVEDTPVEVIALPEAAASRSAKPQPIPDTPTAIPETPSPLPQESNKIPVLPSPMIAPTPQSPHSKLPPNSYRVTVGIKDTAHPSYGIGNSLGFTVNGEPGKTLILKRGIESTFDVATDIKHDFYLTTSAIGWGSGAFGTGVRGNFTYRGEVTITPTVETPDVLYYQCRNHKSMGGKILIVNADADLANVQRQIAEEHRQHIAAAGGVAVAPPAQQSPGAQKMSYASMLFKAKGSALAPPQAKQFEKELAQGHALAENKDDMRTLAYAEDYIRRLNAATAGRRSDEALAESRRAYVDLLDAVHSFEKSHAENSKRAKVTGGKRVDYDKKQVEGLVNEAAQLAAKNQYDAANPKLQQAQRVITLAINEMLHQQTLVYDKNFATPKDEYEFELGRHDSYVELIPVAKEQRAPSADLEKLIEPFSAKAENLRAMAVKTAGEGDHKNAVLMLQAGTENVQRILRLLGVSM
ncbi:MAG: hypothetical protein OEW08_08310 [Gammaproteobacteria bacterium]|nr:hypothetical protein [Gammaproteobacteria bacterium]